MNNKTWKILETPEGKVHAVTAEGDGRATAWSYGVWGPVGCSGIPKDCMIVREPKNKAEREKIASHRKRYERSLDSQMALAAGLSGNPKIAEMREGQNGE